jgi:hypothetical protein
MRPCQHHYTTDNLDSIDEKDPTGDRGFTLPPTTPQEVPSTPADDLPFDFHGYVMSASMRLFLVR